MSSTEDTEIDRPQDPQGMERRVLIRGAAWSIPVVALAAGIPSVVASTEPAPAISLSFLGAGGNSTTYNGEPEWEAPGQSVQSYWQVCNSGEVDLPAGAVVTIWYPYSNVNEPDLLPASATNDNALFSAGPVRYGTRVLNGYTEEVIGRDFVIGQPLAIGECLTLQVAGDTHVTNNTPARVRRYFSGDATAPIGFDAADRTDPNYAIWFAY